MILWLRITRDVLDRGKKRQPFATSVWCWIKYTVDMWKILHEMNIWYSAGIAPDLRPGSLGSSGSQGFCLADGQLATYQRINGVGIFFYRPGPSLKKYRIYSHIGREILDKFFFQIDGSAHTRTYFKLKDSCGLTFFNQIWGGWLIFGSAYMQVYTVV